MGHHWPIRTRRDDGAVKGTYEEQPIDRFQATFDLYQSSHRRAFPAAGDGAFTLEASASFYAPAGDLQSGSLRFHLATNRFELAQMPALAARRNRDWAGA